MKAVYLTGHGGNEVVAVGDRPVPERQPGEARVRMHAATLNRVDLYMRNSGAGITHRLPQIMGLDGAGVVEAVDDRRPVPAARPAGGVACRPGLRAVRVLPARRRRAVLAPAAAGRTPRRHLCRMGDGAGTERVSHARRMELRASRRPWA
jgi:NADPH:quinone reductase-like Zn-dependent oxidoreductase